MVPISPESAWKTYALAGRPDFLNYLHAGDVTWPEVWSFYRTYPADTDAVVRICGLFHMFESLAFDREGNLYISDGYVNARVIKFNKDGEYLTHWGKKGTGDGEFNLVHDVWLDTQERVYVANRNNQRIQSEQIEIITRAIQFSSSNRPTADDADEADFR